MAPSFSFFYKQQILGFIEYRTAALYHASDSVLEPLNALQNKIVRAAGMSEVEALMHGRLAPLKTRRDMAILGMLHRQVLGRGPALLGQLIKLSQDAPVRHTRLSANRHRLQLCPILKGNEPDYVKRGIAGAVDIYNLLPPWVVEAKEAAEVSKFMGMLQDLVKSRASAGCPDWPDTLSPRVPIHCHPLLLALL